MEAPAEYSDLAGAPRDSSGVTTDVAQDLSILFSATEKGFLP
jgi:hypothetical protein